MSDRSLPCTRASQERDPSEGPAAQPARLPYHRSSEDASGAGETAGITTSPGWRTVRLGEVLEHVYRREEFLHRYFSRPPIWRRIEQQSTGTTQVSRNRWREEQFLVWRLSLPPIHEQERIAAVLRSLDEATQANEEALAAATALKKAV